MLDKHARARAACYVAPPTLCGRSFEERRHAYICQPSFTAAWLGHLIFRDLHVLSFIHCFMGCRYKYNILLFSVRRW